MYCNFFYTKINFLFKNDQIIAKSFFQALMPFAASPTFGFLYRSTVAYYPEAFLLMLVCFYVVLFFLILSVHIFMGKVEKKKTQEEKQLEINGGAKT